MNIENMLEELRQCKGDIEKIVETLFKYQDVVNDENFYTILLNNLEWWYPRPFPPPPECYPSHFEKSKIDKRPKRSPPIWNCVFCLEWAKEYENVFFENYAKLIDLKQAELHFSVKNDYTALKEIRKVLRLYDIEFYKKWRKPQRKKLEEDEE